MRRVYILLTLILLVLFAHSVSLGQAIQVVIDPGHGGPGASKYGPNGDGGGSRGPLPDGSYLSEQWVNLQVSLMLKDYINWFCIGGDNVLMTREDETTFVSLDAREDTANFANCDFDPEICHAPEFIPLHHNGLPADSQGVETFWCDHDNALINNVLYPRNKTDSLAMKIFMHLRDEFTDPPYRERGCKVGCFQVIRNTISASCYSEATNLSNPDEALLFDDPNMFHIMEEALAIYGGWKSYYEENGIVTVDMRGLCDLEGKVAVDGVERQTPYYTCWTHSDAQEHIVCATSSFTYVCNNTPYTYQLHHWLEVETGFIVPSWLSNCLGTWVDPDSSTHTFLAYYSGGPYSANLYMPDGWDEWIIGDSGTIIWGMGYPNTSPGVDATTLIDVYLDRNSGNDGYPEVLFTDIPRVDYLGIKWSVTSPPSSNCRIKIVAEDCVENTASDASSYDFVIRFPNIVGDVNTDGSISVTDITFLINFLYKQGDPPEPLWKGDVNGNCEVSLSDIVYLINYLYKTGPSPDDCDTTCWNCNR